MAGEARNIPKLERNPGSRPAGVLPALSAATLAFSASLAMAVLSLGGALAQSGTPGAGAMVIEDAPERRAADIQTIDGFIVTQEPLQRMAGELLGNEVVGVEGEVVGEISDLLLDRDDRIIGVIVGLREFIVEREVGIPVERVLIQPGDETGDPYRVTVPHTRAELEDAREFMRTARAWEGWVPGMPREGILPDAVPTPRDTPVPPPPAAQ